MDEFLPAAPLRSGEQNRSPGLSESAGNDEQSADH